MFFNSEKDAKPILILQVVVLCLLVVLDSNKTKKELNVQEIKENKILNTEVNFLEEPTVLETNLDPIPDFYETDQIEDKAQMQAIYFLKFYGAGLKIHSKIVKVFRPIHGDLKKRVKLVLKELSKGPTEQEQEKGIFTGMPENFSFGKKVRLKKGILHISVDEAFAKETGKDLLQDRIDQLSLSLFEFEEIKGIILYINDKRFEYLGKDNLQIPNVITRKERKIVLL
ncbi:MAG: GerMN domain-containing protein [Leptospiraceae bacterium]|nr:GerMN domain-containing protein [Leptospiraceae bacterium]